jgi:hypothetical protein
MYYLFYAGVTNGYAQSIMLATSTDPSEPGSWTRQGVVLQPTHAGSIWEGFDTWSDCRDPLVLEIDGLYHLYYTGYDIGGGIVGLATASSLSGPWTDKGAVVTVENAMPENPALIAYGGHHYLFYNHSGASPLGQVYRHGSTPTGPWSDATYFRPGWAHEFWTGGDGRTFISYLMRHNVNIRYLTWDDSRRPPYPFIGEALHRLFIPAVVR